MVPAAPCVDPAVALTPAQPAAAEVDVLEGGGTLLVVEEVDVAGAAVVVVVEV